ncbi:MAG: imidazole glycerol phosphate synthase subunit HisF, partial [Candidatus Omnitrophota bacterium]
AGDPVEVALVYEKERADELVFLDITASFQRRKILLDVVRRTASAVFMPFTVGGGIRNIDDVRQILNAGADKVSINTAAIENPSLVKSASRRFGAQCIVVAIDAKRVGNAFRVYSHGGRKMRNLEAISWAKKVEELGAGEILLTSMDRDGTQEGFDLELTRSITSSVSIPVIASGGAGKLSDFAAVLTKAKADAALAASLFHFRQLAIPQVKKYLKSKGIAVRL